jgi:hypothetical protein
VPAHRTRNGTSLSPVLQKAWRSAHPSPTQDYQPTSDDTLVAEALLAGATTPLQLSDYTGLSCPTIRTLLSSPQTMAWISCKVRELLTLSVGVVDAALYSRATGGDVPAIRLFLERHQFLQRDTAPTVNIKLDHLPTEDLLALLSDKKAKVLDVASEPVQ